MFKLDYILLHFRLLYPKAMNLTLGYGESGGTRIGIRKYRGTFFEQQEAPPPHVVWKDWKGEKVPFFFEEDDAQEIVSYAADGSALINYDLIASAFYLLSGWQEYHSTERDRFGRYSYNASVQAKHGFITRPFVNYYFDILKEVAEQVHGFSLGHSLWGTHSFATCLTHDIDRLHSAWKVAGLPLLRAKRLNSFFRLQSRKLVRNDAWFNIWEVMALAEQHRLKATYFWMANNGKYNGHPNADYDVAQPTYSNLIRHLRQQGHEVALHGSFGTSASCSQLLSEAAKLHVRVKGNRYHYLQYQPERTPQVLEESQLDYDSTLGFAEHFGFRNSFCHPFYPFDFKNRRACSYVELPLILMDTTLYSPNYMNLQPSEVPPLLQGMLEEIRRFNGLFTLLWHNENISDFPENPLPEDEPNWRQVLQGLLNTLHSMDSCFLTCSQAASLIKNKELKV